jgi:Fungal specific transcription factor domain/Fungal Zn(2)-Cys(6) binuclear cluster domain
MPASDHKGPPNLADFACARCWKQKKKCDRLAPRCGRCTMYGLLQVDVCSRSNQINSQAAVCIYSTHPPKESVFAVRPLETPTQMILSEDGWLPPHQKTYLPPAATPTNHYTLSTNTSSLYHGSKSITCSTSQASCEPWSEEFTTQVHGIFAASGKDAQSICRSYFENFHPWLAFISEQDFWPTFSNARLHPEFSTLLLSMYLITHIPTQVPSSNESLDSVYFTAKSAWTRLQMLREPSIVFIQAGLLLATYESGQASVETSRSTMVACAELGYKMRLDKSIRRKVGEDLCGQNELKLRRRLWWGIVMLER